jgi:Rieske Fe-S protein
LPRRGFFARTSAVLVAAFVGIVPLFTGLAVFFDPLRRKGSGPQLVRVAALTAVPADGVPRLFNVIFEVVDDAWTRFVNVPVGSVYIERSSAGQMTAFNATCPHAGCLIGYLGGEKIFKCPCHDSRFELNGDRIDPETCPSPRNMDSLKCEIKDDSIWVYFENFQVATPQKKPKT